MLTAVEETTNLIPFPTQAEFTSDDEVIESWLTEKAVSTAKTYQNAVEQCLDWCGCGLKRLTFTSLQNYRLSLQYHYKVTTARKKLSAVRSLLAFACDMGYLTHNPSVKLRNIKPDKDKAKQSKSVVERILTPEEVKRLYQAGATERDRAMIKTAYLLGLRIDELLNLHASDFSRNGKGEYRVKVIGKGSKERMITVPTSLFNELKALGTEGYIFVNYKGGKMTAVGAHKMLKKTIAIAGLPSDISWHWLRHSCASHSLLNGASLESVRKKLGHSSIAITNTYIHDEDDASQFIDL
jgi:integrase/recombinase XerD